MGSSAPVSFVITIACARLWSFASLRTNRTRTPAITSACAGISSFISSQGIDAIVPLGRGATPDALAAASAFLRRRASASSGLRARYEACVFDRCFRWQSDLLHARCRSRTRGSGTNRQRQCGQRFRRRIPTSSGRAAPTTSCCREPAHDAHAGWAPTPPPDGPLLGGGGRRSRTRASAVPASDADTSARRSGPRSRRSGVRQATSRRTRRWRPWA